MNDEFPFSDDSAAIWAQKGFVMMMELLSDSISDDHDKLQLQDGLTKTEVQAAFQPLVADLLPAVANFMPGDEEPVMKIVDRLSRSRFSEIREAVTDNFVPVYNYLRGHDCVMVVIDRLQADADPEVCEKMRTACQALGIVRPTKPDVPSAPSDTPTPRKH